MPALKGAGLIAFNVMMKHMADVQETLCRIIADKYGLDEEEMMKAVVGDPRWYAIEQPDLLKEIEEYTLPVVEVKLNAEPPVNKVRRSKKGSGNTLVSMLANCSIKEGVV